MTEHLNSGAVIIEADIGDATPMLYPFDGEEHDIITYFGLINVEVGEDVHAAGATDLLLPGGNYGDWTVFYPEAPRVLLGDHVVLVGRVDEFGVVRLASWANGVYKRTKNALGLEVVTDVHDQMLATFPCDAEPTVIPSDLETELDLTKVDESATDAMSWVAFIDAIRSCRTAWGVK